MKIAFVDNNQYSIYPPENAIDAGLYMMGVLSDALIKKQHDVTIFAPKLNNLHPTQLISSQLHPFFEDFDLQYWANKNIWQKFNSLMVYDADLYVQMIRDLAQTSSELLHLHTSPFIFALPFIRDIKIPKVFTLHTTIDEFEEKILSNFLSAYTQLENLYFVSISKNQIKNTSLNGMKNVFTIYHGINTQLYPFSEEGSDRIIFIGRLNANKGPDKAIEVARSLNRKILVKGRISTEDPSFFHQSIQPYIDNSNVVFDGSIDHGQIPHLFGTSKLFLSPIQWEEPFGLVMIEAMATGTPVVAYARGSVPEVIVDGQTGFLVNPSDQDIKGDFIVTKTGIEGLKEAVERIYAMNPDEYKQMRKTCRDHVENHFTVEKMVDEYEKVYEKILYNR